MNTKAKHSSRSRTQKLWLLDHHFPCRAKTASHHCLAAEYVNRITWKDNPSTVPREGLAPVGPLPYAPFLVTHLLGVTCPQSSRTGQADHGSSSETQCKCHRFLWDVSDPLSKKARRKGPFPFSSPRLLFLFLLQLVRGWGGGWTAWLLCSVRMCGAAFLCFFQRIQASGLVIEVILILRWLLTLGLFLISLSS